jgi:hypothetical protein
MKEKASGFVRRKAADAAKVSVSNALQANPIKLMK